MFDVPTSPRCIFCLETDKPFTAVEHVLPEGLGNKELILPPRVVCDACNHGPLSIIDQAFLDFTPIALIRLSRGVRTKSGRYPSVKLGNAAVRQTGPNDVGMWVHSAKAVSKLPGGGFTAKLLGQRMTPRYVSEVTRFLFKAALEFIYADLGQDEALSPKFNEVRRIALGARYGGYLVLGRSASPHDKVTFMYQPVQFNGEDTVWAEIDAYGVMMATDLLLRDGTVLRPDPIMADIIPF